MIPGKKPRRHPNKILTAPTQEQILSIIVAMGRNRVIGSDGAIPWHLPSDLRYFKKVTMGCPIIMGRKTWESIGRPLPGRLNLIVSRTMDPPPSDKDTILFPDLNAAIAYAQDIKPQPREVFIIGGGMIFEETLPQVQRIYLTEVDLEPEGDCFFPKIDRSQWRVVRSESHDGPIPHSISLLERSR